MDCPYCAEKIKDAAIVCKHCRRDLFVIRPLMEKLADATRRLEALEAVSATAATDAAAESARATPAVKASPLPSISPLAAMSIAYIVLVAAHFVIIIEYNLPLLVLRIISIAAPLALGFLCRQSGQRILWLGFAYGLVIAVASILSMSAVVAKFDNVPVLPRNAFEWRELAEYGASIAFGFLTGVIGRQIYNSIRATGGPVAGRRISVVTRAVASKLTRASEGDLAKMESVVRTGAAVVTAIVSITMGLKQFL